MRSAKAAGLLLVLLQTACSTRTVQTAEYRWAEQNAGQAAPFRAGEQVAISTESLATWCYTYSFEAIPTLGAEYPLPAVLEQLRKLLASPSDDVIVAVPPPPPAAFALPEVADLPPIAERRQLYRAVEDTLFLVESDAGQYLNRARNHCNASRQVAIGSVPTLAEGPRARLTSAESSLASQRLRLRRINQGLDAIPDGQMTPELTQELAYTNDLQAKLEGAQERVSLVFGMNAAAADGPSSDQLRTIDLSDRTEQFALRITGRPRWPSAGINTPNVDSVSFRVQRPLPHLIGSTGAAASLFGTPHFTRDSVPDPADPSRRIEGFVDTADDGFEQRLIFPVLMLHLKLSEAELLGRTGIYGTVAARSHTVAGNQSWDAIFGPSVMLFDFLMLHGLVHYQRVENLTDFAGPPIPAGVRDRDAVEVNWDVRWPSLGVSFWVSP